MTTMEAEEHVQNIRGSVRPQHVDERRAPCRSCWLLLMLVPAQVLLRSAPPDKNKELDIVFYRPPADRDSRAHGRFLCREATSAAGSAAGRACTRAETETERSGWSRRAWETGTRRQVRRRAFRWSRSHSRRSGKAGILAFKDKFASLCTGQGRAASRSRCALRRRR